jgi:hypothetical protein
MALMMSSAIRSRPMLRNAPASRPAIVLWPPSRSRPKTSEASRIVASAVRASVGLFSKKPGELAISAAGSEKSRSPSFSSISLSSGTAARTSKTEVLYGSGVALFLALGERTRSCRGTV